MTKKTKESKDADLLCHIGRTLSWLNSRNCSPRAIECAFENASTVKQIAQNLYALEFLICENLIETPQK